MLIVTVTICYNIRYRCRMCNQSCYCIFFVVVLIKLFPGFYHKMELGWTINAQKFKLPFENKSGSFSEYSAAKKFFSTNFLLIGTMLSYDINIIFDVSVPLNN